MNSTKDQSKACSPPMECHCCNERKQSPGFRKVMDIKDVGLTVYQQSARPIKVPTADASLSPIKRNEVFIFENTGNDDITPGEITIEIVSASINDCKGCIQCRQTIEHAQNLLLQIPSIKKKDIVSVCDDCFDKNESCFYCEKAIQKFISTKKEQNMERNERIKIWLDTIKGILKNTKELNDNGEIGRAYSEVNLKQLMRKNYKEIHLAQIKNVLPSISSKKMSETHPNSYSTMYGLKDGTKSKERFIKISECFPQLSRTNMQNKPHDGVSGSKYHSKTSKSMFDIQKSKGKPQVRTSVKSSKSSTHRLASKKSLLKYPSQSKRGGSIRKHRSLESVVTTFMDATNIADSVLDHDFLIYFPKDVLDISSEPRRSSTDILKDVKNMMSSIKSEDGGKSVTIRPTKNKLDGNANITQKRNAESDNLEYINNELYTDYDYNMEDDKYMKSSKKKKDFDKEKKQLKASEDKDKQKKDATGQTKGRPMLSKPGYESKNDRGLRKDSKESKKMKPMYDEKEKNDKNKITGQRNKNEETRDMKLKRGSNDKHSTLAANKMVDKDKYKDKGKEKEKDKDKGKDKGKDKDKDKDKDKEKGKDKDKDKDKDTDKGRKKTKDIGGDLRKMRSNSAELSFNENGSIVTSQENEEEVAARNALDAEILAQQEIENLDDQNIVELTAADMWTPVICAICDNPDSAPCGHSLLNKKAHNQLEDIIIGKKIKKCKVNISKKTEDGSGGDAMEPALFKTTFICDDNIEIEKPQEPVEVIEEIKTDKKAEKQNKLAAETELPKGIMRFVLSDTSFIEKGWTMLPTEKIVRKMNVYRMRPAHPEFDWFQHNKLKGLMEYDSGERLAEFDDNGCGRWYYRNGRLALNYYDAIEANAQQRIVVFSNGEPDERGRSRPYVVLAMFDFLGNGVVFDHTGKVRLKYNQTEGIVLDRSIGPVSHWKWHTLNDPPVLQQVMIDTQMAHKDPTILMLGDPRETVTRPDNEDMLAIEFDNFIKEKSKKLTQSFKPFQIKMKALKINENFSLKILDQANVYLIYRDGKTHLKINIGMILDHKEIIDTDTEELGEVSNSLERFPARTESIDAIQKNIAIAQQMEKHRFEHERRLRGPETSSSADKLFAAASKPLRPPMRVVSCSATVCDKKCKYSRKPSCCDVYYDTRYF